MPTFFALVAQWIERHVSNLWVGGSIPSEGISKRRSLDGGEKRENFIVLLSLGNYMKCDSPLSGVFDVP